MSKRKKEYSKKDIIGILKDLRFEISHNPQYYLGGDRHIYRKATEDAMAKNVYEKGIIDAVVIVDKYTERYKL